MGEGEHQPQGASERVNKFHVDKEGHCVRCDKWLYKTRKDARRACNRHHRGEHKQPYRCPHLPELWHIGTLSQVVTRGHVSKDQRYSGAA